MYALTTNSVENSDGADVLPISRGSGARWNDGLPSSECGSGADPEPLPTEVEENPDESRGRVVVVHSDGGVRRALALLLEGEGYSVAEAEESAAVTGVIARARAD